MPKTLLESPHTHSERILVTGGGGSGKSTALMTIAELLPHATFHVIEKEVSPSYELMMPRYGVADRMTVHDLFEGWEEYLETLQYMLDNHNLTAVQKAKTPPHARPWLVVDSCSPTWQDCQHYWHQKTYGDDIYDEFLKIAVDQKLTDKEKWERRDKFTKWEFINDEYFKSYHLLAKWRGNLFITTKAGDAGNKEKPERAQLYGPWGVKPKGQPDLHYASNTTLIFELRKKAEWTMTTLKDREREMLERAELNNFATDYLVGVAGWERKIVRKEAA